jgi:predicted nucleotidyltransferase
MSITQSAYFLIEKENRRQAMLDKRFKKAWKDFNTIVTHIIDQYKPKKIYQWGSLLDRKQFSEFSDIDIAVEGIVSVELIFKLYGDILNLSDFQVDIVQLEKIEPEFADIIRDKGKIIYERKVD